MTIGMLSPHGCRSLNLSKEDRWQLVTNVFSVFHICFLLNSYNTKHVLKIQEVLVSNNLYADLKSKTELWNLELTPIYFIICE